MLTIPMLTTTLLLLLASGAPQTLAAQAAEPRVALDYTAAKALADRDEAALPKLAANAMRASQSGVLNRAADACRSDEKPAPFTVVLELDAEGKPTGHWRNADTGLARCVEDKLARAAFYIPAKAPFYVSFEVSFTP